LEYTNIKKILGLGPESTDKTTLCKNLAKHFNTLWVPEYARESLETKGPKYNYDDLEKIAAGQLALEDKTAQEVENLNPKPCCLFIATDLYVMNVWSECVFGKCSQFILENIVARKYDLYLLCNIDVEWVKDALREYPDESPRKELMAIYTDVLANQTKPWQLISGNYDQRTAIALKAVEALFKK
jgi:NadR type nicotinamide-nucleotide adenylyltransferase